MSVWREGSSPATAEEEQRPRDPGGDGRERPLPGSAATGTRKLTDDPPPTGSGRLVLVSNRLPVAIEERAGGPLRVRRTMGGLATGLGVPHQRQGGRWIGWPGVSSPEGQLDSDVSAALEAGGYRGVGLDPDEYERFYVRTCNRCIWPLLHGFVERVHFDWDDWDVYRQVNRRFADAVLEDLGDDDLVFVQDFHLLLVPEMIRHARPRARIGFFLHVPFPSVDAFRVLPPREEALRGLLGADVIGFHTLDYVSSFRSAVRRVLGSNTSFHEIDLGERQVALFAQPLGVDVEAWSGRADPAGVQAEVRDVRRAAAGRRVILGVERLDYTKGIPQRLLAFSELLSARPELAEELVFFQIAVPSRVDVDAYRELRQEVDRLAGEINGRFGRVGLQPLHYQFHGVDPHRLTALYRCADVCMVTPLRDGLNLVAKEFVAARQDDDGVLLLSEFTGAAWELPEAVIVNPYDVQGMTSALERSLSMDHAEQAARMGPMRARVRRNDIHRWTGACLQAIAAAEREPGPTPLTPELRHRLVERFRAAGRRTLALDWDGTLRELEPRPELAVPTDDLRALLERLAEAPGVDLWIVSGRPASFLEQHLDHPRIGLIAEHGAFVRPPGGGAFRALLPAPPPGWKDLVRTLLDEAADRVPGSLVEEKTASIAWHYRACEPDPAARQERALYHHLGEVLAQEPLEVLRGSKVLEVRPVGISKGCALRAALEAARSTAAPGNDGGADPAAPFVLVAGDDLTDESLFEEFPDALSILVGARPSVASHGLASPAELRALLAELLAGPMDAQAGGRP